MQSDEAILQFDDFRLDLRRRVLLAGGQPVALNAKPFDLLKFFVLHSNEDVSRDRIEAGVWPGQIVGQGSLSVQLSALRKALEAAGGRSQLILTLPGQKYRFVADVAAVGGVRVVGRPAPFVDPEALPGLAGFAEPAASWSARPSPAKKRKLPIFVYATMLLLGSGLAAMLAAITQKPAWMFSRPPPPGMWIVVLPFRNLSDDKAEDHLADAVTDGLTSELSMLPAATVIARESAVAVRDKSPQEVGRELHVRYVVDGSLRPEEKGDHITAGLIDTATGAQLWTEQFDSSRDQLKATRENIVRHIAGALHFQLTQEQSSRSLRERPDDPNALDLFWRAKAILDRDNTLRDYVVAQTLLEKAIGKQPDFAEAQAELGWMLMRKVDTFDDPDESHDYVEAKAAIQRALALSPSSPVAIAAFAKERLSEGKCAEAKQDAKASLTIDASGLEAHEVLATCAQLEGHLSDAISQYETLLQLNPNGAGNKGRYLNLGIVELAAGRIEEAQVNLFRAISDDGYPAGSEDSVTPAEQAQLMLIATYQLQGKKEKADANYGRYVHHWPRRTVWRMAAYFPRAWTALPGFQAELKALRDVGMPQFSSDNEPGISEGMRCGPGDFAATPSFLPNGEILTTNGLAHSLASSEKPLVIDIGRGAGTIPGSIWYDPTVRNDTFDQFAIETASRATDPGSPQSRSIVLVGDGPAGCAALDASKTLQSNGFMHVAWYRGGEEAWVAASLSSEDQRTQ